MGLKKISRPKLKDLTQEKNIKYHQVIDHLDISPEKEIPSYLEDFKKKLTPISKRDKHKLTKF